MSLNLAKSTIDRGSEDLLKLGAINGSEESCPNLENEDVSLGFDVTGKAAEEQIVFNCIGNPVDLTAGSFNIEVVKEGLEEDTEDVVRAGSDALDGNLKCLLLEGIFANLVLSVRNTSGQDDRGYHVSAQRRRSHLDDLEEVLAIGLRISQNSCKKSSVCELFGCEAEHE